MKIIIKNDGKISPYSVFVLLIMLISIQPVQAQADDEAAPSRVILYEGLPAVRFSVDTIRNSGIQTRRLAAAASVDEVLSSGRVVDLQPLLASRAKFDQLLSDQALAEVELQAAMRVYEQLRLLHRDRANVTLRQVEEARLHVAEIRQRQLRAEQQLKNTRDQARQQWGEELSSWALSGKDQDDKSQDFDLFLERKECLILVSFPTNKSPDQPLPDLNRIIYINSQSDRTSAQQAQYISPATHTDPALPGATYYYRSAANQLRTGMRLNAWIRLSENSETGVLIPHSAVIWYGGQPWVYQQVAEDEEASLYSRRPLSGYRELEQGWFLKDRFNQNDRVVTRGGQILLSEEMRWQIPDEDDN